MSDLSPSGSRVGPLSPSPTSPGHIGPTKSVPSGGITACVQQPAQPVRFTDAELASLPPDIVKRLKTQENYVTCLEERVNSLEGELSSLKENEERLRSQHAESQQREKVLVRRLAAKEQEMQDCANQMAELKTNQTATPSALRLALLDPAVNLLLQHLRRELVTSRARLDETQNELSAWKFTPDSNTGKRLMAKCRLLYTENEELGKLTNSGRVAKLEGELALQKSFSEEVKKSQSELDEFLQDLDEDVEGMQSTIYYLQQELRQSKETVKALQSEISSVRSTSQQTGGGDTATGPAATVAAEEQGGEQQQQQRLNGNCKGEPASGDCGGGVVERTRTDSDSEPELTIKVSDKEICDDDSRDAPASVVNGDVNKRTYTDSDSSESNNHRTGVKKVRRSSVLSLDYNDDNIDDDALVISANGDGTISDAE